MPANVTFDTRKPVDFAEFMVHAIENDANVSNNSWGYNGGFSQA